jgi:hypothetical protein
MLVDLEILKKQKRHQTIQSRNNLKKGVKISEFLHGLVNSPSFERE